VRFDTDLETLQKQVTIETYRAPGPGGQHKNKTETAVRLTHLPSGIVVTGTESRSQAQNRETAFRRLQERLERLNRPRRRRIPTKTPRKAVEARHEEKRKVSGMKRLRRPPVRPGGPDGE
jgi:ribosome-associated protein